MGAVRQLYTSFLVMLAAATEKELAAHVQFLRAENKVLRSRLPARITCTPKERTKLLRYGRKCGSAIKELVSIVSWRTFYRWAAEQTDASKPRRRPGRPKTPKNVRDLVVRIAREMGVGYTRVLGELRKLGLRKISRGTVKSILLDAGIDPSPERSERTWDQFIKQHVETLWACDFFSVKSWTLHGLVDIYLLVFIHIGSRRVWVSPPTAHPTGVWTSQQARNALMQLERIVESQPTVLLRDRDTKFTPTFDEVFTSEGAVVQQTQFRSPNLNAYCERWIQSCKQECLEHFVVFGEAHLDYLVQEYVRHFNAERPHSSLPGHLPPLVEKSPEPMIILDSEDVVCRQRLGGLLRHYARAA